MECINPKELMAFIEKRLASVDLIDIRSQFEYDECHLPNAISIPINSLKFIDYSSAKPIAVFYCNTSSRTFDNVDELTELGYKENYILLGGIGSWKRLLFPVCTRNKCRCLVE